MKNWMTAIVCLGFLGLTACGDHIGGKPANSRDIVEVRTRDQGVAFIPVASLRKGLKDLHSEGGTVSLVTMHGQKVEVAVADFERALANGLRGQKYRFSDLYVNGDGSVTVMVPRLDYRADQHLIGTARAERLPGIALGVCRHFGFNRELYHQATTYDTVQMPWMALYTRYVEFSELGEHSFADAVNPADVYFRYLDSVSCID